MKAVIEAYARAREKAFSGSDFDRLKPEAQTMSLARARKEIVLLLEAIQAADGLVVLPKDLPKEVAIEASLACPVNVDGTIMALDVNVVTGLYAGIIAQFAKMTEENTHVAA